MIRRGAVEVHVHSPADPDQLYDLASRIPEERRQSGGCSRHEARAGRGLSGTEVARRWDLPKLDARRAHEPASAPAGRMQRSTKGEADSRGTYQPVRDAAKLYMRNTIDLDDLEARARFPRV